MRLTAKKIFFKVLKITGIAIVSLLLLMFLLPILFPDFVAKKIKSWANGAIVTELNFSKARLSFFNHFPSLTLTLYDVSLKGSAPFEKDTLIKANEIALGVALNTIFSEKIRVDEIYLSTGKINIKVDKNGKPNYNVYRTDTPKTSTTADTTGAQLRIELIQIEHSDLVYDDHSIPILIAANELNYSGKGDLSKSIFDLYSDLEINRFDLNYDSMNYIGSKRVEAQLITKINTNSLAFVFEKNDLRINSLPVQLKGNFEFLQNGYNMEFRLISKETDLHDVLTAMPPEYMQWLNETKVDGKTEMDAYLTGRYIEEQNIMPDLGFNLKIRNGYISNQNAPSPIKNLFLNFDTKLPSLNTDSLQVNIDSIFFNIDKDYFSSIIKLAGIDPPYFYTKVNSNIDLEKWDRALGLAPYDLKGKLDIHFDAEGKFGTTVVYSGLRQVDTVLSSIPRFNLQSSLRNGYFKYTALPQPVSNISFNINASCPDSNYHHAVFDINNINATALDNYIKGSIKLSRANDLPVDANLQSLIHLSQIKQFYPLDSSIDVRGDINANIQVKGKYNPSKKLFPVTKILLSLNDGLVQTKYYPRPIEKIHLDATVRSTSGSMKDLHVKLQPLSFEFIDHPFTFKADLKNFEDLHYKITSKGTIDIGRIYKVFAISGYNVNGFIETNLALSGTQSDATAKQYSKLNNSGTLKIRNIVLTTDLYPQPFYISRGLFRFQNEKMWFDNFNASYGKTKFTLKGYLFNVINYVMEPNTSLQGNFEMTTPYLYADEFMAYAETKSSPKDPAPASGVVMIPSNLSLTFDANANKISYNDLDIKDFKGQVQLDSSKLKLNQTGFSIIDAPVVMDASYQSLSRKRAAFTYHITANDFDIHKAYNEIKLFRDLAPSAASAQGIISLDYSLDGKLNADMYPIYPSLKGGGVLSVKKVKMKGFKLMNAVSRATDKAEIQDPDLSKVKIKSTIANNIITVERVKLKVKGFRPRFEGQYSFDGKINFTGRLGLPPFGIIGIPFTVTGTQESPRVHIRRSKETDKIEETTEEADADEE